MRSSVPVGSDEHVEAGGGDVLAERARRHPEALARQHVQHLAVEQVHLAQVRLVRVALDAAAVAHGGAGVCVALDADPRDELERRAGLLRERVLGGTVQGADSAAHSPSVAKCLRAGVRGRTLTP